MEEKAQSKSGHFGYKTFLLVFSQFACRVRPETLDIISTDKTTLQKPLATTQLAQRPISKHKNIKWQPTTGSTFLQTTWMVIFSEFISYFQSFQPVSEKPIQQLIISQLVLPTNRDKYKGYAC